ncbi:MAG: hypothetical protein ABJB47_08565, partial [Actinomycetota bacterium]
MEVVGSAPAAWFWLRDGEHQYVDVNCSQSAVSFSILLRLDDGEAAELHALGTVFLDYFAAKVSYWPDRFWPRNITGPLAAQAHEAVISWQRS